MIGRPLRVLELRTVRGTGGGPDKTILQGTALTDRTRYDVTICYLRDARDTVYNIDQRAGHLPVNYTEVTERHSLDWKIWPALRRLVREREIDIVHGHDYKTNLLALLLARSDGVIPVSTAHGWVGKGSRETRLYYPFDRWQQRFFHHVIAVSSTIKDAIVARGTSPDRVTVVLNGVDPQRFRRDPARESEARAAFDLAPDAVVIGAVGRLEREKNFALLVRAFARVRREIPSAVLVIAGGGSQRAELEQLSLELGLSRDHVRLPGLIDDVALLHHALDVFVQSSDDEGTPNVVLEAMALETPIVATNAGGTAEVARHDREALIIDRGDEDALVRAVLDVLRDPSAAQARVAAARVRVETELSFERRTRRIEEMYDAVAARAGLTHGPTRVHA
jgi:glycosyltransferase involved in cell wall biosynthesis